MNKNVNISLFFTILLMLNIFLSYNVEACKDIIACGDSTNGDYNLLLKVRDPSRPGIQVLCIVPEGYTYSYHHPWSGKTFESETLHKYIGVATKGDTIPNIVKAGMTLTDAGIAFGDADSGSRWVNPTRNSWDDFDWIRYACEKADSVDHATLLLTEETIEQMHATGVSESLFIVGPEKGVVIEGDAFHYKINEIKNGVAVMSNYPKELWKTQRLKTFLISRDFDTVKEKSVRNRGVVRLNSLYGIRVVKIENDHITVKPISFIHSLKSNSLGSKININLDERQTVGFFSVELLDIENNKAKIRVTNKYKAWEEKILEYIEPKYGKISIRDMMNWSRLHTEDLTGLRAMCEDFFEFEAVTIYKIPNKNYEKISSGWFSPNHACSSIYVPFHICNTDIYNPYETGEAAELSLKLLNEYGHGTLEDGFSSVEEVFLNETDAAEKIVLERIDESDFVTEFLTIIDTSFQKQAFVIEEIWLEISKIDNIKDNEKISNIIDNIWESNYSVSLKKMKDSIKDLEIISKTILEKVLQIGLDICKSRIDAISTLGKSCPTAKAEYDKASINFKNSEYEKGFDFLIDSFEKCENQIHGKNTICLAKKENSDKTNIPLFLSILMLIAGIIILVVIGLKQKR